MHVARSTVVLVVLLSAATGIVHPLSAQTLDLGGRAYVDYFYTMSSPDGTDDGLHGFTYRRLYLTADYTLSDDFGGRARLEANEGTTGPNGPVPYVKDLYLTWRYGGEHSATMGVTSPPAFDISDDLWGYRSLEKTVLDLRGIASSRDFGVRFDGSLTGEGDVRYALMLANNNAGRPETDRQKRIYGQVEVTPTERLTIVAGADHAGYGDARDRSSRLSAFGSYTADPFRVGVEVYGYTLGFENRETVREGGVSMFGVVQLAPEWELVARIDQSESNTPTRDRGETFVLAAVAYQPNPNVKLMPNLRYRSAGGGESAETHGRLTLEVSF